MNGEITPDTYDRDLKINERAEAWIARAIERLNDDARVEAEIGALAGGNGATGLEETATSQLEDEIDMVFIAALKENWWIAIGTLGALQYQLELMTKNNPDTEPFFFDQQYGALKQAWEIGRLSSPDHQKPEPDIPEAA